MADFFTWEHLLSLLVSFGDTLVGYLPRLMGALLVFLFGWWVINRINRVARNMLKRRKVEQTMRDFLATIIVYALRILLITSVVTMIGVETASVLALLTSFGVAVGLALSGTLQNFAGGLLILVMRHVKVGDEIEAQGFYGVVERIELFYTILKTFDHEKIVLPNGPLSTQAVRNTTANPFRRVEVRLRVQLGYDIAAMRQLLYDKMTADERTQTDPAPYVIIDDIQTDAIIVSARSYVETDKYWPMLWDFREDIYNTYRDVPEVFPYPKLDVDQRRNRQDERLGSK